MELYQFCQNRANQTIAVINQHIPGLTVGGLTAATLSSLCANLDGLAQTRETKVADEDAARNAENLAFRALRTLVLSLPAAADAELDDDNAEEDKLASLLDEVYSVTPRTTESAVARGRKLVAALTKINAWLASRVPPRPAITAGGKSLTDLNTALTNMPALEQAIENTAAAARDARNDLHSNTRALDRLNKRFYKKLQAEARTNPDLAAALHQIQTENSNLPETLSILSVLQSGPDSLHVTVNYIAGTGTGATSMDLEWMVEGVDPDFINSTSVNGGSTEIGPFSLGHVIHVRTRTTNANGTRTSAPRTLTLVTL